MSLINAERLWTLAHLCGADKKEDTEALILPLGQLPVTCTADLRRLHHALAKPGSSGR